jgi:hypothetical protein
MKSLILMLFLVLGNVSFAQSISGEVSIKGTAPKGVLYIFAKKFGGKMPMPLAVKKIVAPKFPLKFELSQKDAMMKEIPFKGPFVVTARLSPSGDASDKSGLEVSTIEKVSIGQENIQLILAK